jgi:hypothetical protein
MAETAAVAGVNINAECKETAVVGVELIEKTTNFWLCSHCHTRFVHLGVVRLPIGLPRCPACGGER